MNVKALAAIVGTLSLGALATGCASSKSAETTDAAAKGTQASCNGAKTDEKGSQASCNGTKTESKANESGCAANGGCSAKK